MEIFDGTRVVSPSVKVLVCAGASVVQRIEHTGAQPTSQQIRNVLLSQNAAVYSERSGSPQRQAEGGMLAGIMESRSHYWQGTLGAMAMASALAPAEERA